MQLNVCTNDTGKCNCRENVTELKCDRCEAGLFLNGPSGCVACDCETCLSVPPGICDGKTGQCPCRKGLTGTQCDVISDEQYLPFLEGIVYEAEEATLGGNASIQTRTQDPSKFTGSGVVRMKDDEDKIVFDLTVPALSIEYDLLVRYQAAADVSALSYAISGIRCPNSRFDETDLRTSLQADFDQPIIITLGCLAGNTQLRVEISMSVPSDNTDEVFVDSVVLFPNRADVPPFQELEGIDIFEAPGCYDNRQAVPDHPDSLTPFCLNHTLLASSCIFNGTQDCECNKNGSNFSACASFGGQCSCKANIVGRTCFACEHRFFSFPSCQACNCNTTGSDGNADGACNNDGQCTCLPRVTGLKCDECEAGFFFTATPPDICQPCDCEECLAEENIICDGKTGQCLCRIGLEGSDCKTVQPNQYLPFLDGVVYEAEKAILAGNASVQTRPADPTKFTGPGVVRMKDNGDQISFTVTVPSLSIAYDLLIRYEAAVDVTRASIAISGVKCLTNSFNEIDAFTLIVSDFDIRRTIGFDCLVGNTQLLVNMTLDVPPDNPNEVFVDSFVLLPNRNEVPAFNAVMGFSIFEAPGCYSNRELVPDHVNSLTEFCLDHTLLASSCIFNGTLECACDLVGANSTECESIGGQCTCRRNVIGRTCSDCAYNTTNFTASGCEPCDCFPAGTLADQPCDPVNGDCPCKPNYVGRRCDACDVNFFDISMCQACNCNSTFSANLQCNGTGFCSCKPGIDGKKCDGGCKSDFFNLTSTGCTACECNPTGSVNSSCHPTTGQCNCVEGVTGRQCDQCISPGFFGFGLFDDVACRECFCNGHSDACETATLGGDNSSVVENCSCSSEFAGLSCQFCAAGFRRQMAGGNASVACVPCECNDHSNVCNSSTGVCGDCADNTDGDFCENCQATFFGDATNGGVCQPCDCDPDGSSSLACNRTTGQCDCNEGFSGRSCDVCSDGFFNKSAGCLMCNCNTTNTINGSNVCNKIYGQCPCIDGISGRTCDQCRQDFVGSPPDCVDCGPCFSNWTGLIDRLICDKVEALAGRIDNLLERIFKVKSRLRRFVECVKRETRVTVKIVKECIAEIMGMIDDQAMDDFKKNITELRQQLERQCSELQNNVTYIENKSKALEDMATQLENEKERLEERLRLIESSLNETEILLAATQSFNGTVHLSDGRYTDVAKLEAWAARLNASADDLQTDVAAWISQIENDKARVDAAEDKALDAQETVRKAVERAEATKSKVQMVNETKANFSSLHAENAAKLESLQSETRTIEETLNAYLERAENATRKAFAANETATKAGNATQAKYLAALDDEILANNLKQNASLAYEEASRIYNESLREKDEAREAYVVAKSTLNDTTVAKEKLEGTVQTVLDAEHYANQTLAVELPPISDIETLARQINKSASNLKADLVALNASAHSAEAKAQQAKRLAMKAMEISERAWELVDSIAQAIDDKSDKDTIATEVLDNAETLLNKAINVTKMINKYAEDVHAISMESKRISSAANASVYDVHKCREEAIADLTVTKGRSCRACDLTTSINQNLANITNDVLALRDSNATRDATMDNTTANGLLRSAEEKRTVVSKGINTTLMDLLGDVKLQRATLESQKERLADFQMRMSAIERQIEEQCRVIV